MNNYIKKALVLCLSVLGMHTVVNAVSQIGYQKSQGMLQKLGLKSMSAAEEQAEINKVKMALIDVEDLVKNGDTAEAYSNLKKAEGSSFFERWIVNPTNTAYSAVVNMFAGKSNDAVAIITEQSIKKLKESSEGFEKILMDLKSIVSKSTLLDGSREETFKDAENSNFFTKSMSDCSKQVRISIEAFKIGIKDINPSSLSNRDFTAALEETLTSLAALSSYIDNDLVILNNIITAKNSNYLLEYVKSICKPIVLAMQMCIELSSKELNEKSDIKMFSRILADNMLGNKASIELINKITKQPWSKMDIAKYFGAGLLAGVTAYYLWKNKSIITEKVGKFELPASVAKAKDVIGDTLNAGYGMVTNGAVYVGGKGRDFLNWIPFDTGLTTRLSQAAKYVGAKGVSLKGAVTGYVFGSAPAAEAPQGESTETDSSGNQSSDEQAPGPIDGSNYGKYVDGGL